MDDCQQGVKSVAEFVTEKEFHNRVNDFKISNKEFEKAK